MDISFFTLRSVHKVMEGRGASDDDDGEEKSSWINQSIDEWLNGSIN